MIIPGPVSFLFKLLEDLRSRVAMYSPKVESLRCRGPSFSPMGVSSLLSSAPTSSLPVIKSQNIQHADTITNTGCDGVQSQILCAATV